jgi:hypothetical protein
MTAKRGGTLRVGPAVGCIALIVAACGSCTWGAGGLGQACRATDQPPLGGFKCDQGLVCNSALPLTICEEPNTHAIGEPCSDDDNCRMELTCYKLSCVARPGFGEACFTGCAPGLECVKTATVQRCEPANGDAKDAAPE